MIKNTRSNRVAITAIGIVITLSLWHLVTAEFELVTELVLPAPLGVLEEFIRISDVLLTQLQPTMTASLVGFVMAGISSFLLAVALVADQRIEETLMPFIIGGNMIPRITLAPLIIFYVGSGVTANYFIAAWVAFFPMLISMRDGLAQMEEELNHLFTIFGASTWQRFRYLRIIHALPFIFDALRVGVPMAIIGAVVGEFVISSKGIGFIALFALENINMALLFAAVMILGFITGALIYGIYLIQSRVIFWQQTGLFTEETR